MTIAGKVRAFVAIVAVVFGVHFIVWAHMHDSDLSSFIGGGCLGLTVMLVMWDQ
jgi:hypothetical protein